MWCAPDLCFWTPGVEMGRLELLVGRFVALPGLLLLSFGALYDVNPGNVGLALLFLATFIVAPLHAAMLRRERLFWLMLAFLAWVLLAGWYSAVMRPDWEYQIWSAVGDWLLTPFLGMFVTAFWIARFHRVSGWLLILLVAGFMVRILQELSPELFRELVNGTARATFGDSANNFGIWSLLCTVVLLGLIPELIRLRPMWLKVMSVLAWLSMLVVASSGIILSQTRAAWIAVPFAMLVVVYRLVMQAFPMIPRRKLLVISLVPIFLIVGLLASAFSDVVMERVSRERSTISQVLSGQLENLPDQSIGYRLRMYYEGVSTWVENPFIGGGPAIPEIALAKTEDRGIRQFNDFHNAYLDLLASFGLIGFLMICWLIVTAVHSVRASTRADWMSSTLTTILLGSAVTIAVTQLFSSSLHSYRGPFVVALLLGLSCAWRFVPAHTELRESNGPDA